LSIIQRVISGGQTGADQGGLRAARACGMPTGGWAPRGWLTEAGPAPWLAEWGLAECLDGDTEAERYRSRRRRCVNDCSAALVFGDITSPGSRGLLRDCRELGKRCVHVQAGSSTPRMISRFLIEARVSVLMVDGNRESREPGIGPRVERFLCVVFRSRGIERPES
jgi:Circularly permutated YpsA SLOG family